MRPVLLLPAPLLTLALTGCLPELPKQKPGAPEVAILPAEARTDDELRVVIAVESSDADGDAVTYTYTWKQAGVPRPDLTTDTVPASETTKGEAWEVTVTPSDVDGEGTAATALTTILNTLPTASVTLSPESPTTGDPLVATATATDADGDAVTLAYAWTVDGQPADASGDTLPAEDTARGERWSVTVTPSDAEGAGAPVTAEVGVVNSAPVVLSVELVPAAPFVTDAVVAVVDADDADGDPVGYTYTWFVDGSEVQSGEDDTLPVGSFVKHQRVSVEVTPRDSFEAGAPLVSADALVLNSLPTATGASIDPGAATEASTLTCVPAGWADADGDAESWTYAWSVNGAEVATTATLDGGHFDKGDTVACAATPFDGEENGVAVTTAPLSVANTPPALASATLSSTAPTEADTLSVTLGAGTDADGDALSHTYAWVVNGSVVATGSTLTGSHFDKGDTIHVVVTPNDGSDDGAPVTSDTATAANTRPVVSGVALSPGSVYTNDTLSATVTASDADGDTLSHTYAWYVAGALVQSGASSTLSGAAHFDRDEEVYVVVTPNDGESDGASVTSSVVTVLNTAPTAPGVALTPADAGPGDDLTCSVVTASTDADGDAVTYTFAWDVDGVTYAGAVDAATRSVVDGAAVEATETWMCAVTADDGTDEGDAGRSDRVEVVRGCNDGSLAYSSSGVDFVEICAGSFDMGCTPGQSSCGTGEYVETVHNVEISRNYYLSKTEVTQGQYQALMGSNPASFSSCGASCPIEEVTWHMAAAYANALSRSGGLDECYSCTGSGRSVSCTLSSDVYACSGYRLPTESEWEGAARCGEDLLFSGSSRADDVAWYASNSSSRTHAVGLKAANACGLYDMSGNVNEWVQDWYEVMGAASLVDPVGPAAGLYAVFRGGGWFNDTQIRVSSRSINYPTYSSWGLGFRLARTVDADHDGDGYTLTDDCDDTDSSIHPRAGDTYGDGVDSDCDGMDCAGYATSTGYVAVCRGGMTWADAASECTDAGYDSLASITTATEQASLRAGMVATGSSFTWIGLNDVGLSGTYRWSDGTPVSYTNWAAGEPSRVSGSGDVESCTAAQSGLSYAWNDAVCSLRTLSGFACSSR